MKNKILILTAIIIIILTNLYVVSAEDNSPRNGFSWRYEVTENLTAGDDITIFADGLEVPHNLILALYQDRKLVDLSANDGERITLMLPNDFSNDNEWTFKAFVWDGISSMTPLENSLEVKLVTNIDITDKFTDVNFLNAVRAIIGKSTEEAIYKSDVENITSLDISHKDIQNLDGIEYFTALEKLDCSCNELKELNVSNSHRLREAYCYDNRFLSLDFSDNPELEILDFGYNTDILSLNISNNTALKVLACHYTSLTSLNISNAPYLTELYCYGSWLEQLDVSNNIKLQELECWGNRMTSLDVSKNTELTYIDCGYNRINTLDVSNNKKLLKLDCSGCQMLSVNDVKGWRENGLILGETFIFDPQDDIITDKFTDTNFLNAVRKAVGKTGEEPIYKSDVEYIEELDVSNKNITSLNGIEYFTYLEKLDFSLNTELTSPDLSKNEYLKLLICRFANLETLDLSNNTELTRFYCDGNKLTELNISENKNLEYLSCTNNQMNSVDDVNGWKSIGLILDDTFKFDPQRSI